MKQEREREKNIYIYNSIGTNDEQFGNDKLKHKHTT